MRRVALIYNPFSGQHSSRRSAQLAAALAALRQAGVEAEAVGTQASGSAGAHALAAIDRGCDTILACGGDGTVHEILQCLVGKSIALGVVPLGTANALAADLGLLGSPVNAVRMLLQSVPVQVPVGRIVYRDSTGAERSRYFTVAAGVGADALLMSRLDAGLKRRFGYALYLVEAVRIWATSPFPLFEVVFTSNGNGSCVLEASQVLAVRVRSFGGVLGNLVPGATLHQDSLRLIAFKTRDRLRYLRFLMAAMAGRQTFSDEIQLIEADSVECRPRNRSRSQVLVEADGEVLGGLPARLDVASQTVTLLIPPNARP
jgi:YegS/Rv2252/BmrU family lipid kinase